MFETLEEDLEVADCVLWVGISFEQSASVEYFRRVRSILGSLKRLDYVTQVCMNCGTGCSDAYTAAHPASIDAGQRCASTSLWCRDCVWFEPDAQDLVCS